MTNNSPEPTNGRRRWREVLSRLLRRRSTIIVGASAFFIGVVGYTGIRYLVYQKLPEIAEEQLSILLQRPVEIGEVERFWLLGLRLGPTFLPATPTDPDTVTIKAIEMGANPLPLLLGQPLKAKATIIEVDAYIEQDASGKWIEFELPEAEEPRELPIPVDVMATLQEIEVTLRPYFKLDDENVALADKAYENSPALTVEINGEARYVKDEEQSLTYDIQTDVANAEITVAGQTILDTGKTQLRLVVEELDLAELVASILPNLPITLDSGLVNTSVDAEIPAFSTVGESTANGELSLGEFALKIDPLKKPIIADINLEFEDSQANFSNSVLSVGDLKAQLTGFIHIQDGLNLGVNLLPFDFKNIEPILGIPVPDVVDGAVQGQLNITGPLLSPTVKGKVTNTKPIRVDRIEVSRILTEIEGDLEKIVLKTFEVTPKDGGKITGSGAWQLGLKKAIAENRRVDPLKQPLAFNFDVELPIEAIAANYAQFNEQLSIGTLTAKASLKGTPVKPNGLLEWNLPRASGVGQPISGSGKAVFVDNRLDLNETVLLVGDGRVTVDGRASLTTQDWQTQLIATGINLEPFVSVLLAQDLNIGTTYLSQAQVNLSGTLANFGPETIEGIVNAALWIDGGDVALDAEVVEGFLNADASADGILVEQWLSDLPIMLGVNRARANLTGDLIALWRSLETGADLSSFRLTSQAQLALAEGIVDVEAFLVRNQWQLLANSRNLDSPVLLSEINQLAQLPLQQDPRTLNLPDLVVKVDVVGNIADLFKPGGEVPIQANTFVLKLDEQYLNANGRVTLANLRSQPDISSADLQLAAFVNLAKLPVQDAFELVPVQRDLLPTQLDLQGEADFRGQLLGRNLITRTFEPGSATLTGNLQLTNLAINEFIFDPVLSGPVKAGLGQAISVNLRGQDDVIYAVAEPCTAGRCRLPYLPVALEFRRIGEGQRPVIATGKRRGDRFLLAVEEFPLDILGIAPATSYGIPGLLAGDLSANVSINLFNLSLDGDVEVLEPGVGNIRANIAAAEFAYDSQRQFAEIRPAFLELGESRYDLAAALNLNTWQLESQVQVKRGYLEDLVALLPTDQIPDLVALLQNPEFADAADVSVASRGNPEGSIREQINLLWLIEKQIIAQAERKRKGRAPDLLDLQGSYNAELAVNGLIKSPNTGAWRIPDAQFSLVGDRWQWYAFSPFPSVVEPLGLVLEDNRVFPINELVVKGTYSDGTLQLDPARVQLGETLLAAEGTVSSEQIALNFSAKEFTLDLVRPFAPIPKDIAGVVNLEGQVKGSVANPELVSQVAISEAVYQGRTLETSVVADLSLLDGQLQLQTVAPSSLQLDVKVADVLPLGVTKTLAADLVVETEVLETFDELVTLGQLAWQAGEGNISLQVQGDFNLFPTPTLETFESWQMAGVIDLDNATVLSQAFAQPIIVNGQVLIDDDRLRIPELMGSFASSQIAIAGVLPLFAPLSAGDPDQDSPLAVVIDKAQMDLEGLYAGGLDAQVLVSGSVLGPLFSSSRPGLIISGGARLSNGEVFVPQQQQQAVQVTAAGERWGIGAAPPPEPSPLLPQLDNFQVVLDDLKVEEFPLFKFGFGGELVLNGNLPNLREIEADGVVQLNYGQVSLIETRFVVDRVERSSRSPYLHNSINFLPGRGLLNPELNVHLRSYVSELPESQKRAFSQSTELPQSNEFPDDSLNTVRRVNVFLSLEGEVAQILPNLGKDTAEICQIRKGGMPPIQYIDTYTAQELEKLSACIESLAFQSESEGTELLNPYVVKLTSRPYRSRGQIIQLLANQILVLADAFSSSNESSLIQTGIVQLALPLLFQNIVYDVEYSVGRALGATDLTLFPIVEASYGVGEDSYLSVIYDYTNTEGRVQFETRF